MAESFISSDQEKPSVHFIFGVKDIDRTGDSMWNAVFVGEAILDPEFNFSKVENQQFLFDFCTDLENLDFIVPNSADCWYKKFVTYMTSINISTNRR